MAQRYSSFNQEVWHWVSDRGNIKFHTMTVHREIVYLVGTDLKNGVSEIAIIGIDGKTGIVYSV
jgi:hypothetical protein